MKRKDLIEDLKSGYDPDPSSYLRELERLSALCELAANALELDQLKFIQLDEINREMTNMVLAQSKHIREYENLEKVKRLRGI